ncbi:MAG: Gfo/Idh/MocA family oxidoreductase [Acidobacteriia bacterium]|nr:Gfo/Idh/MocA family oxidoreductase [Terriglobia bacterium]
MKRGLSRREFMRTAGAAVATQSFLLEPRALAASPRPVPPSETVRFGIIGVGMRGAGLLRTAIGLPGVECVAACELCDGRQTLAKEIVDKPITVTRRYQELLERKDIDCIIASVPDHWHKQIVVDCCQAGKDVYVEKPMTHTVEEGFEIIHAAREHNRIVQVGSQEPSSVVYAKARELLTQGAIGKLCLIEATMGRNSHCGVRSCALDALALLPGLRRGDSRRFVHPSSDRHSLRRRHQRAAPPCLYAGRPLPLERWPRCARRDDDGLRLSGFQSDAARNAQYRHGSGVSIHGRSRHPGSTRRGESRRPNDIAPGWPRPRALHARLAECPAARVPPQVVRRTRAAAGHGQGARGDEL